MNFLAHIFLSGDNDLVKIGNFMADGIRGKEYKKYNLDIQKGILLHREIDTFTDQHPIFKQSTKRLHANYHHYSGVIVDIFYDHFLAKNWQAYSNEELDKFITHFYQSLHENYDLLSEKTQNLMPYMIKQNWLLNYQYTDGIKNILTQMDRRTNFNSKMQFAIEDLTEDYSKYEEEFTSFFKEIQTHISKIRID